MLELNKVYMEDCFEGVKKIDDNSVDLIITDVPYNIGNKGVTFVKGKAVRNEDSFGEWDIFDDYEYKLKMMIIINESWRILKDGGSLYFFSSKEMNPILCGEAIKKGFEFRNFLVLVKKHPIPSFMMKNWRNGIEFCFYVSKGKPKTFNFISQQDCINYFWYQNGVKDTEHPTEKDLNVIKKIVKVSSNEGDIVFDFFMGSGTTAVASKLLNRKFIGFELKPEYVDMINERLAQKNLNEMDKLEEFKNGDK